MNKTNFTSIRLDDQEKDVVDSKMKQTGLGQAAAIRLIIREWSEMQKKFIIVPVNGVIKDGVIDWDSPEGADEIAARG
jgi:hypothetical protein